MRGGRLSAAARGPAGRAGGALAVWALCCGAGCWTSRETGATLQRDVAALRGEVRQLGRRLDVQRAAADEATAATAAQLAALRAAAEAGGQAARQAASDVAAQREHVERDLADLRNQVETAGHAAAGPAGTALPGLPAAAPDPAAAEPGGGAAPPADGLPSLPKQPRAALAAADALLAREPAEGRSMLRAIVRRWPKEMGTTDEALMRLGDSLLAAKEVEPALQAYLRVVDTLAASRRATEAYFQLATCAQALGRLDDAATFYGEVANNRPRSEFTARARTRLAEVTRQATQARGRRSPRRMK